MDAPIRVLYAEDDPRDADLTRSRFALEQPAFEIEIVDTGEKCWARLQQQAYDILLLDYRLPDMDGIDLLKRLVLGGLTLPAVMVTGLGDEEVVVQALRLGAIDYVPKSDDYLATLPSILRGIALEYRQRKKLAQPLAPPRRRVLYIERHQMDIDLTLSYFSETAPHLVATVVRSCAEALQLLRGDHGFDLVIADLRMPDMSALDFFRVLKHRGVVPPFVIITGQGDEETAAAALKLGAADYIVKRQNYLTHLPYTIDQAIARFQLDLTSSQLRQEIAERQHAENALKRRASQLMLLSEVGSQIAAILELKSVFEIAVRLVQESFGYHHVALFMVDHAQNRLMMQARAGKFALLFPPNHIIPLGQGVVGWVGLHGEELLANDVNVELRYTNFYPDVIPTRSELAVPIRAGGAAIGVLDVQSPQVSAFDENDVLVIKTLADQIAVAIENARLYEAVQVELAERKRAEETIQNLAKFSGENPSPVFRLNADGLILYANEASHVLLHEWQCRVGEPAPQMWRELCLQALAAQSRHTLDYEYGGEVYAFVVTPIVEFNYVNLYAINITVRKQAEDALRRSAQRLEILHHIDRAMLAAQSPEAIAETALLRLRELIPFQLGGIVLFDADETLVLAAVPNDSPALYSGLRLPVEPGWIAALQHGQPILVPNLSVYADLSIGVELLKAANLQAAVSVPLLVHGQLLGTLNLAANTRSAFKPEHVDIATEVADQIAVMLRQARLHEQVQRHADELEIRVAERTRELNVANEQLKELDRAKDQFVSNVSHELRTPLANLKLYLSLLERGKPEKHAEYMQTLRREHSRLDKMIEDLLDLSRLDLGVTQVQPVPIDLGLLLSQLIADRTALAAERQLELDYRPEPDLPLALVDPMMLTEVITNLVGNAVNYTPVGGVVVVSTAAREEAGQTWVTFKVQDNGLGISARDLPHLFERFYRGEVGRKANAPGTGLGLAISQGIVEKMGGRITVANVSVTEGTGAAFTVWLKPAD